MIPRISRSLIIGFILTLFLFNSFAATLSTSQRNDLNNILDTHLNYFLSAQTVTSYGMPLGAYRAGDRGRYNYSNPTEWGYLLQAYIVAAEKGKITKANATARMTTTLTTIKTLQDDSTQNYNKLFYPYYYVVTRPGGTDIFPYHDANLDIPSIDNALFYMSLVIVDGWAQDNGFNALATLVQSIHSRMKFHYFIWGSLPEYKFIAHLINASTGAIQTGSRWDTYADEAGLMSMVEYLSGSVDLDTFKVLINNQNRGSAAWNGYNIDEAQYFNPMFVWGVRSLAGIPMAGTPYSTKSLVPNVRAALAFGASVGADYPGYSDAMTQGYVGTVIPDLVIPPNLQNKVPATSPAHSTPHAFFIPLNVLADLDQTTVDTLINKANAVKADPATYYYGTGSTYPFGFVVTTSPFANALGYNGVNATDGKNVFENLSHAYTSLSIFNALQYSASSKDFPYYASVVSGITSKINEMMGFLYPNTPCPTDCVTPTNNMQITCPVTFCPIGNIAGDIKVIKNNLTIDCNGDTISSIDFIGRTNVVLKNCNTYSSGRNYAVLIDNSVSISLLNNNFGYTLDNGIKVLSSSHIKIANNAIYDNEWQSGIFFDNVTDSEIDNNNFTNNGWQSSSGWPHKGAIALYGSSGNKITRNTISGNAKALYLTGSNNNTVAYNSFCSNNNDSF